VYCFERHQTKPVTTYPYAGSHLALAIASTGRWITTGNQDATVHIWHARDGDELTMAGYPDKVTCLAFDPTGRYLANDGAPDVTVWDFAGKGPNGTSPRLLAADESATALAWQPGATPVLATGGEEGNLTLWHPATGRAVWSMIRGLARTGGLAVET
jgi:WD40 repeat protein